MCVALASVLWGCVTVQPAQPPLHEPPPARPQPGPSGLAPAPRLGPTELARVRFTLVGDIIPHGFVKSVAAAHAQPANNDGWDFFFEDVADIFRSADVAFANLETPVAPTSRITPGSFLFNAPLALVEALKRAGISVVSFANNHVMDMQHAGFVETLGSLRQKGLPFAGSGDSVEAAWEPVILEKNGLRIGLLGMTRLLNGNKNPAEADKPHVNYVPYATDKTGAVGVTEADAVERVRAARAKCDVLLVSIHWGQEYAPEPLPVDVELGHAMLEAGAEAIIGHHAHVLQPIEGYVTADGRQTMIFYSLGNFLSNQGRNYLHGLTPEKTGEVRDSAIAQLALVKRDYGKGGVRVELAGAGYMPVWGENNFLLTKGKKPAPPVIRPLLLDRELARVREKVAALQALPQPLPAERNAELLELLKRVTLLERRRELLVARLGDDYLIPTPPPAPATAAR